MTIADDIRTAYQHLAAAGTGFWVSLVDLRAALYDIDRDELDAALINMLADPQVQVEPEPFGHRVGPAERRAAVHIGGEDRHKIAIGC